jgi:hypothetical protein
MSNVSLRHRESDYGNFSGEMAAYHTNVDSIVVVVGVTPPFIQVLGLERAPPLLRGRR